MKRVLALALSSLVAVAACGREREEKNSRTISRIPLTEDSTEGDADGIAGLFKGYEAINRILRARIITSEAAREFTIGDYIGDRHSKYQTGLTDLLGVYAGTSGRAEFRNAAPNGVNMVIWHIALSRLANHLAAKPCSEDDPGSHDGSTPFIDFNSDVTEAIESLCQWPKSSSRNEDNLANLWQLVMGYDAPEEERLAWQEFFMGKDYKAASAYVAVSDMLTAVMYNPYFLLRN